MLNGYCYCIAIGFAIAFHFICIIKEEVSTVNQKQSHYNVVLGILSSREHFMQRSVLRDGIRKQSTCLSVLMKFIVSRYPCKVPPEDRIDIYHCKPTPFLKPSTDQFFFHFFPIGAEQFDIFIPDGPVGFDFVVNHQIAVESLGLYDQNSDGFKGSLKVILYETPTGKEIISATFLPFGMRGLSIGMHVYKHNNVVVLPKGFHGSIVIEGCTASDPLIRTNNYQIDDGGGLITYVGGYRYGTFRGSLPEYVNNIWNSNFQFTGPSFIYSSHIISTVANGTLLSMERSKRYDNLRGKLHEEELQLQFEQKRYQDLLLVDIEESYRNLPHKMLKFHEWVRFNSFDYIMKTDDDCFVNMTAISNFLRNIGMHHHTWIGNFRRYFPLDMHGKWQEHNYKSRTYPPFACGSGYILSSDIITWIFMNRHYLYKYQGEDVSLGIWLSAINPILINEPRFHCFGGHYNNVFSLPENNLTFLKMLYNVDDG